MAEIPSRAELAEVWNALSALAPCPAFGVTRPRDRNRLTVLYCYQHGFGEFVLPLHDVPEPLQPALMPEGDIEPAALLAHRGRAFEGFLLANAVQRLVSLPMSVPDDGHRLWVGLADAAELPAGTRA